MTNSTIMKTRTMAKGGTVTTIGRDARGRFSRLPVSVVTTERGHWYRTDDQPNTDNDTVCRGCGRSGHFDYILDYKPCATPATPEQIRAALVKVGA